MGFAGGHLAGVRLIARPKPPAAKKQVRPRTDQPFLGPDGRPYMLSDR